MAHHNTVLAQLLKFFPRHEFEALANRHHEGQKLRKMTRWSQFVALSMAQLAGRSSLRDTVSNLSAQTAKLYHLGSIVVMDCAYIDYTWFNALNDKGIFFVTRQKRNATYKARWRIELFFKCIKQNLKIKSFVGTSRNAVLTQIWIAMCAYLLLAWIKFSSRISRSFSK